MSESAPKDYEVRIRLTRSDWKLLDDVARAEGRTKTSVFRRAVAAYAAGSSELSQTRKKRSQRVAA